MAAKWPLQTAIEVCVQNHAASRDFLETDTVFLFNTRPHNYYGIRVDIADLQRARSRGLHKRTRVFRTASQPDQQRLETVRRLASTTSAVRVSTGSQALWSVNAVGCTDLGQGRATSAERRTSLTTNWPDTAEVNNGIEINLWPTSVACISKHRVWWPSTGA